jgi:hypothetical protein
MSEVQFVTQHILRPFAQTSEDSERKKGRAKIKFDQTENYTSFDQRKGPIEGLLVFDKFAIFCSPFCLNLLFFSV